MILDALQKIVYHKVPLTREEARAVMGEILKGEATDAQIAGLAVALHMKGETVEEIVGFAEAIRYAATPLVLRMPKGTSAQDAGASSDSSWNGEGEVRNPVVTATTRSRSPNRFQASTRRSAPGRPRA